ncbi:MAG: M23 family metallopeptidase [Leptospiraceae bacterium]|nr:M23 family metallopeptidase [Leptospiraceae bacterium]
MRRWTPFALILILTTAALADQRRFEWPLVKGNLPDLRGITSTFGESRDDHFHAGLDIASQDDPVESIADGRILYSRRASDNPFRPLPGPGNLMIIDHGDGWWSGYFHLQELARVRYGDVTSNTIIGYSGNTGRSGGAHLHFFVAKNYGKEFINPLEVLPKVTDTHAPVVQELIFFTEKGKSSLLPEREHRIRLTKAYPVHLNVRDPGLEGSTRRGVYQLSWSLNGKQQGQREFSAIDSTPQGWLLSGALPFESVFTDWYHNLGILPFQNGRNVLKVKAADYAGNVSVTEFILQIQKEY